MEEEEIEHLKKTVAGTYVNRNNPIWIKAFGLYNEKNIKQLGMNCAPCYGKVLNFILGKPTESINKPNFPWG